MLKINKGESALIVVAHPDDETIWMGGFVLLNPQVDWTIFSLSRANDIDRAPKFKKVCSYYGAKSIIADFDDENDMEIDDLIKQAQDIFKNKINQQSFDYIFTHGENGEYGHDRHIATHYAVRNLFKTGVLTAKNIFSFNYKKQNPDEEFSLMISGENPDFVLDLDNKIYQKKKIKIMSEIYGFDPNGIDASYCTNPESFNILK